jgi:hypothetical protein
MNNIQEQRNEAAGHNKEFRIVVNGREKIVRTDELSFAQVIGLAFDNPPTGENIVFTVTYRRGHGNKPEGTLVDGEIVKIKEGMIFNVTATYCRLDVELWQRFNCLI